MFRVCGPCIGSPLYIEGAIEGKASFQFDLFPTARMGCTIPIEE